MAGVLLEEDYSRATMAMRELSVESALARLEEQAEAWHLAAHPDLPPAERLVDLGARLAPAVYVGAGIDLSPEGTGIRRFSAINTEIAAYLALARPTVSVHAKILREAGLIRSYQEGRVVRHEIVPEEVYKLFRDLAYLLDLPEDM